MTFATHAKVMCKRGLLQGLTVATLSAVGCSGADKSAGPPPPNVTIAVPLARDVTDWDEYIGRFEAPQSIDLSARVTGVVVRTLFHPGQDVQAGQALFVIDPRPYRATLAQTEAQIASTRATLINARSVYARSAQLVAAQAVSTEESENDQAAVRTAAANLQAAVANADLARLNLSFTTVRSPVSGRVSDRRVSIGDQVIAGTTLLTTVVSLDPIWFTFDGAESFYLKYQREAQKGQRGSSRTVPNPVDIKLADETSFNWHGRMEFLDNAIDPRSGTIRAHAVVANARHFLTPGMFGRARLLGSGTYRALLVPNEVIVADQSRKLVMVLGRDGTVVARTVETGPEVVGLRAIRSGLAATDLVILDGLAKIQPGMKVVARRTTIRPLAPDTSPMSVSVTTPQPSTATSDGDR